MEMGGDRHWSYEIKLDDDLTAYVHCKWIDSEPGHVASSAEVVVRNSQGDEETIGNIPGPLSRDAMNDRGTEIANNWYDRQNG